jgi:hypothetical protein
MAFIDIDALSKQADGRPLYHVRINTESNSFFGKDMKDTDDVLDVVQAIQEDFDALGIAHIISLDDQLDIRRV